MYVLLRLEVLVNIQFENYYPLYFPKIGIYKIVFLIVLLYGCDAVSCFREEHNFQVF
jgi:hypothetical protein